MDSNLTDISEVSTSVCVFDDYETSCSIQLDGHTGSTLLNARLDQCATPARLNLHIQMPNLGQWRFQFLSGNPAESHRIGPDWWPVDVQVKFGADHDQTTVTEHISACLQTVKTGVTTCFIDHYLDNQPPCPSPLLQVVSESWIGLCVLIVLFLMFCLGLVSTWTVLRRVYKQKESFAHSKYYDQDNSLLSQAALPGAKTYANVSSDRRHLIHVAADELDVSAYSKSSNRRKSKALSEPDATCIQKVNRPNSEQDCTYRRHQTDSLYVIEELSVELNQQEEVDEKETRHNSTMTECKQVQTSLSSLDEGIASSLSGNGSHNGESTIPPLFPSSPSEKNKQSKDETLITIDAIIDTNHESIRESPV